MHGLQFFFVVLVIATLAYLVVDGLRTGSVWVKGSRNGLINFTEWVHKRSRAEEPGAYWMAIGFYSVAFLFCLGLLVFGPNGFL